MNVTVEEDEAYAWHDPRTRDDIMLNLHGVEEYYVEHFIQHCFLVEWLCILFKNERMTRECTQRGWKACYRIGCRPQHVVTIIEDELEKEMEE